MVEQNGENNCMLPLKLSEIIAQSSYTFKIYAWRRRRLNVWILTFSYGEYNRGWELKGTISKTDRKPLQLSRVSTRTVSCIHPDAVSSRWACVSRTCPCFASCGRSTSPSRSTRAAVRTWAPPPASAWWRTATSTRTTSTTQSQAPLPPGNSQTGKSETGRHRWQQARMEAAAVKTTAGTPFTSEASFVAF